MYRTNYCGEITEKNIGENIVISGWVNSRRDHGGVVFFDMRDITGIVQVVYRVEEVEKTKLQIMEDIIKHNVKPEYVLKIDGKVVKRSDESINPKMKTGRIEIVLKDIEVLNTSKAPIFDIETSQNVAEDTRLKYRYLDLRNPKMQDIFIKRSLFINEVNKFLSNERFLYIETPILTKSTPEGARDYLVPSRVQHGMFYALPQSPQLFKQLLMISGFDRYYQIAKCFRDEDLRADRQPEFTQLDLELSFVNEEDIFDIIERMLKKTFSVFGIDIGLPIKRLPYSEAMSRFGSDKPDTRFGMEIFDATNIFLNTEFKVFRQILENNGKILGIKVEKGAAFSRKELDSLIEEAKDLGAKGLLYGKYIKGNFESPLTKFAKIEEIKALLDLFEAKDEDLILIVSDKEELAQKVLGTIRVNLAKKLGLIDPNTFDFLWVYDFPMFEYSEEEKRLVSKHHPFTMPSLENFDNLENLSVEDKLKIKSRSYDIIMNGVELGGGSIRIHDINIQKKIFKLLNIKDDEAREKFGFLLDALSYGAPPHAGIALGLDRLIMLCMGLSSIRDVIAFPKTQKASCLLTDAPNVVDKIQLRELGIQIKEKINFDKKD